MKDSNTTRKSSLQKLLDQDKRLLRLTKPGNSKADLFFNEKGGLNFYTGIGVPSGNTYLKEDEEPASFYFTEDGWPIPQKQAEKILSAREQIDFANNLFNTVSAIDILLNMADGINQKFYKNYDLNRAAKGFGRVATAFSVAEGVYNVSQAEQKDKGKVISKETSRITGEILGAGIGSLAGPIGSIVGSKFLGYLFEHYDPEVLGEANLALYNSSGESPLYRAPEPSASQQNTFLSPDGWEITAPPPVYNLQLSMDGLIGQVNVHKNEDSQELAAEVAGLVVRNVQAALNNYAC